MSQISLVSRTDGEIMAELGGRLRALRKLHGLNQDEAAAEADLSRRTVSRAELGENPQLATLIRLLRVYGRLDALESFIPEPSVSPMTLLKRRRGEGGRG
jgi:transcriptional regulator with XRE-family HTH domain